MSTIKLSGLSSSLDTESIVSALVSAYSVSKDNLVKAQTKLSWRKDSWKAMNTKIYNFYSKTLTNMKLSSSYNKKTASIADSTIAKVTASTTAVNGAQSLVVKNLASSGYLTGGTISTEKTVNGVVTSGTATTSSKLSEIKGLSAFTSGSISVGTGGKTTTIDLKSDMTIGSLVTSLKSAGVNASFDENNQRLFISSKASGANNDFTLTAADSNGLTALKSLGVFTLDATDTAEYTKWANYTDSELTTIKADAYAAAKTTYDKVATEYTNTYNTANSTVATLTATNTQLTTEKTNLENQKSDSTLTADDIAAIDSKIADIDAKITANQTSIDSNNSTINNLKTNYIILDTDDSATKTTKQNNITAEVDSRNAAIQTKVNSDIDNKVAVAKQALALSTGSTGAVRTVGADASIILNGATFTSTTNNFNVNGLSIQALNKSADNTATTITTDSDVDGMYNMIKDFITGYNDLINGMDSAYNADSSKGYEPLTDKEKESMTDSQVEKWETKIKDSLLRKDSTLNSVISSLKTDMLKGFTVNNKKTTLATFGINTLSYFTAAENEKGAYHIDGNTADTNTSGNADKLRAAISNNPDEVISFFTQLAGSVYDDLTKRMKSSTLRSAYTIYNDKQMTTEYSEYSTKISSQEDKISKMEDYYNRKFTAMETAMSKLNASTSSLSSLLG